MSRLWVLLFSALPAFAPLTALAGGEAEAGRFRIRYSGANGPEVEWAIALFEQADEKLTPQFGQGAPARIQVTLSRSKDEWRDEVGDYYHRRARGLVDRKNEVFVVLPLNVPSMGELRATVVHEAVHAMLGPGFNRNAPPWLVEGVAEYFSGRKREVSTRFTSAREIGAALRASDVRLASDAYAAAGEKVAGLVRDCGKPAVVTWLKALRTDGDAVLGGVETPCRTAELAPDPVPVPAAPAAPVHATLIWSRGNLPADAIELGSRLPLEPARAPTCPAWMRGWERLRLPIDLVVNADGQVVRIEHTDDPCAQRIAETVQDWTFKPVLVDGQSRAWKRTVVFVVDPDPLLPIMFE